MFSAEERRRHVIRMQRTPSLVCERSECGPINSQMFKLLDLLCAAKNRLRGKVSELKKLRNKEVLFFGAVAIPPAAQEALHTQSQPEK